MKQVENIRGQPCFGEPAEAPFVNNVTLLVEDIVVFQQAFSYGKVLFFNLFLSAFYRPGDH